MRSLRLVLVGIVCFVGTFGTAHAQAASVDVLEVKGIIDGSVERAILGTLEDAERSGAALVVLQIDSRGIVDAQRTQRLVEAIRGADVPIAAWVGPPGAEARNGAALLVHASDIPAMSPLSDLGPVETLDLRRATTRDAAAALARVVRTDAELVRSATVAELLEDIADQADGKVRLGGDPEDVAVRFHKLDLFGRILHAAAQPSIIYLLLLLAMVGIVFELFHPSTGPAGLSGLLALGLAIYGLVTLGGSWLGFGLIVAGVAGFALDLRFSSLGIPTIFGTAGLIAGSLLLFRGPWLQASPWVLAFGIISMVAFLLGAMTRVLRDLRAIARGELEVREAHPHPDGDH